MSDLVRNPKDQFSCVAAQNYYTWKLLIPESDIDKNKVHDYGASGIGGVLKDIALLEPLPVHHGGVDFREWHIIEAGPLHGKHQLLQCKCEIMISLEHEKVLTSWGQLFKTSLA